MLAEEKKGHFEPLKPDPYSGRASPHHDRVVLLELFTGAECGPCVAADLAFDALSDVYRTTELITLEYHLHIPRPDPLTGRDSVTRSVLRHPFDALHGLQRQTRRWQRWSDQGRPEEAQPVPVPD